MHLLESIALERYGATKIKTISREAMAAERGDAGQGALFTRRCRSGLERSDSNSYKVHQQRARLARRAASIRGIDASARSLALERFGAKRQKSRTTFSEKLLLM